MTRKIGVLWKANLRPTNQPAQHDRIHTEATMNEGGDVRWMGRIRCEDKHGGGYRSSISASIQRWLTLAQSWGDNLYMNHKIKRL